MTYSSYGLNRNRRKEILQGLNGHNAKVYSGMEQLFVVQLSEIEKILLIKKLYKAVYYSNEFLVNKLSFNKYKPGTNSIETDEEPENKSDDESVKEAEKLFDRAWCIPINPNKSKFNVKSQGEHKGKTYFSEVTAFVNGGGRITVEFFDTLLDSEIAVIFKDSNGNYRILFDPIYSVETDVEQDSGEGITSTAGFTVTFKLNSKLPPVYFYGRIELLSGVQRIDDKPKDLHLAEVYAIPHPKDYLGDSEDSYMYVGQQHYWGTIETGI